MRPEKCFRLFLLPVLCLGLAACSGSLFKNFGRILPSAEVDRDIEEGVARPEIRYYVSGPDVYPNALIGLRRDYRLDPETLWKEVVMTPEKLREIVGLMKARGREYGRFPQGFDLLDPVGKMIGFWYSVSSARTFLKFEEDRTVMILTPKLDTYEESDRPDSGGLAPDRTFKQ
jgi:hypothetical protein